MYRCEDCKSEFEEPKIEITTYEQFLNVSELFPTGTSYEVKHCPICNSEDIERVEK